MKIDLLLHPRNPFGPALPVGTVAIPAHGRWNLLNCYQCPMLALSISSRGGRSIGASASCASAPGVSALSPKYMSKPRRMSNPAEQASVIMVATEDCSQLQG